MTNLDYGFASEKSQSLSQTPTLPRQVGMLRKIHRTSAVVLLVFITAHLANHLLALQGIEAHIAAMKQLRAYYRHPLAEALLLIAVLAQVITGSLLFWRTRHTLRGFWPRLRAHSGLALAIFLLQHVPAVLVGRLLQGLDTNFYFAAAVLQGGIHKYYFFPYYLVGVTAVFVHLAAVVYLRLPGVRRRAWWAAAPIVTGFVLALAIVLCFAGAFYEIRLPAGYGFP
jgi:hypothetical protein